MHSHHVAFSLTLGVLITAQGARLSAQHHVYTFGGESSYDELGVAVSGAGDVDRDGYPDIVIGATQVSGGGSGVVHVHSGSDGRHLFTVRGDGAGDAFGFAVAAAGDVNKDGYDDIVAGASQEFC